MYFIFQVSATEMEGVNDILTMSFSAKGLDNKVRLTRGGVSVYISNHLYQYKIILHMYIQNI